MQIIDDIEQGSPEWHSLRIGSIGGSDIAAVCAKGTGKQRSTLLYRKAGEIASGMPYEGYKNAYMERGHELEPRAIAGYSLKTGFSVRKVAMVKRGANMHCSPDGLIERDGMIEVKTRIPSIHLETIDKGVIPASDRKQPQWNMFITNRDWCDYISFCPEVKSMPLVILRSYANEEMMENMHKEAKRFIKDMQKILEKLNGSK